MALWTRSNKKGFPFYVWFVVFVLVVYCVSANDNNETCLQDGTCSASINDTTVSTPSYNNDACQDEDPEASCFVWAVAGECEQNPGYMHLKCQRSCGICNGGRKVQEKDKAAFIGGALIDTIPSSPENGWGAEQDIIGTPLQMMATQALIENTKEYMLKQVFVFPKYEHVRARCKNRDRLCTFWAAAGECTENFNFMSAHCAPACRTCDMLDFSTRCPFSPVKAALDNVWVQNVGLNEMFQRILEDPYYQSYQPVVHRRPKTTTTTTTTANNSNFPVEPWIITLENFLSPEECDGLLELGRERGYQAVSDFAVTQRRSPIKVARCLDDCHRNEISKSVVSKFTNLTGIPEVNLDYLQFQQYPASQFLYETHDFTKGHLERSPGPRILTLFVFLSDSDKGGEVRFPKLNNLTILPKRGRAILWPNVLHTNPNAREGRVTHQNLPLTDGTQYGLKVWVHLRDFKTPHAVNCV